MGQDDAGNAGNSPRRQRKFGELVAGMVSEAEALGFGFVAGLWARKGATDAAAPGGASIVGAFPEELVQQNPDLIVRMIHNGLVKHVIEQAKPGQALLALRRSPRETAKAAAELAETALLSRLLAGYAVLLAETAARLEALGLPPAEVSLVLGETLSPEVRGMIHAIIPAPSAGAAPDASPLDSLGPITELD